MASCVAKSTDAGSVHKMTLESPTYVSVACVCWSPVSLAVSNST